MFRLFECCALSFFERFVLSFSLKIERFVSDSAEIWICGLYIAMGTAVVGGMLVSTFLTMYIVPAIYSYISTNRNVKTETV